MIVLPPAAVVYSSYHLTLEEVIKMEVISQGQTDDLIFEDDGVRLWVSRMTEEDGMPYNHQITVEAYDGSSWFTITEYQAV